MTLLDSAEMWGELAARFALAGNAVEALYAARRAATLARSARPELREEGGTR